MCIMELTEKFLNVVSGLNKRQYFMKKTEAHFDAYLKGRKGLLYDKAIS